MLRCYRCLDWPCTCVDSITLINGDSRDILPRLAAEGFAADLLVTDPPYSSGGMYRADRVQRTGHKYSSADGCGRPDFAGDNRDQRSYLLWSDLWLREALRVVRSGAACVIFTDWRQAPTMIDAVQVAGWVYRGLAVWDKTESARPQKGWFRSQAEFMVLGTAGPQSIDYSRETDRATVGVFRYPAPRERLHQTEKPRGLLESILMTRGDWQTVLDPFAGGGSTLLASRELGRRAIGIEIDPGYCDVIAGRLAQSLLPITSS